MRFDHIKVDKYNITLQPHQIDTLNQVWNEDPVHYIDDLHGYKHCLIFVHFFDQVSKIDDLLHPTSRVSLADFFDKSMSIPPIIYNVESVSFCAYNKYLFFRDYYYPDGGIGFVFCYKQIHDLSISPLCFYELDGNSVMRSRGGCGGYGIQMPIPFNKSGYDLHTKDSLSFKEFINKQHIKNKENKTCQLYCNNEVVIKNWYGLKNATLPLSALFITVNQIHNVEMISKLQNLTSEIFQETFETIPILVFDPKCTDNVPFKNL